MVELGASGLPRVEARRKDIDYDIDGGVVRINDAQGGRWGRSPRSALGDRLQIPSHHRATAPLRIGMNVGRTGALNPSR